MPDHGRTGRSRPASHSWERSDVRHLKLFSVRLGIEHLFVYSDVVAATLWDTDPPTTRASDVGSASGGTSQESIVVALRSLSELLESGVPAVQSYLRTLRRARARIAGAEAVALQALEAMAGPGADDPPSRPDTGGDGTGTDGGDKPPVADGSRDDPATSNDEPDAAPRPSQRELRASRLRAQRLRGFPRVALTLEAGDISVEQADLLSRCGLPLETIDELLALAISHGDTDQTRAQIRSAVAARNETDPAAAWLRQVDARSGSWWTGDDGMIHIHATLDPLTGAPLIAEADRRERELYHRVDKAVRFGGRTGRQRRADVLTSMLGGTPPVADATTTSPHATGSNNRPVSPAVHLVIRADHASGHHLRPVAHTTGGATVPGAAIAPLLDDAEIHAWIVDALGNPVGHATGRRHATRIQRLALAIRDGRCVWAGCDQPHSGCDAHHLDEWSTSHDSRLANLAPLCPNHHRRLHQMGGRLRPGKAIGEWHIERLDNHQLISTWTNPPPPWLN